MNVCCWHLEGSCFLFEKIERTKRDLAFQETTGSRKGSCRNLTHNPYYTHYNHDHRQTLTLSSQQKRERGEEARREGRKETTETKRKNRRCVILFWPQAYDDCDHERKIHNFKSFAKHFTKGACKGPLAVIEQLVKSRCVRVKNEVLICQTSTISFFASTPPPALSILLPLLSVLVNLLLPNGHCLLQSVNAETHCLQRIFPVNRRHGNGHTGLPDWHHTHTVNNSKTCQLPPTSSLSADLPELFFCHGIVGLVFKTHNLLSMKVVTCGPCERENQEGRSIETSRKSHLTLK